MLRRAHTQMQTQTCARTQTHPYSGHSHSDPLRLTPIPTHTYSHTTTLSVLIVIIKQFRPYTPTHTLIVRFTHTQTPPHSDSRMHTHTHTHTHSTKKKDSLTHRLRLSHIRAHSKHATRAHQAAGREDGRCFTCPLAARLRGRLEQNASCGTPDATPFRGPCPSRRRRHMTSALTLGHARKCAAHVGISPSTHD